MSMRTPLARVRGLGSAKSGTEHWWHMRLTSVAAIPLTLFLVAFVLMNLGDTRSELIAAIRHPAVAITLALAVLILAWHMHLGMQVIVEDYVHGWARLAALLASTFFSIAVAAAAVYAIAAMSFGA
jgi:succinate dehydrogenase / fumarate reductase membrane anchor subunit